MEGDTESVASEGPGRDNRQRLYRLGSNQSRASVFEDVEMAHDEVRYLPCPLPLARRLTVS